MLATERQDPLILEGIPIHLPERRRTDVAVPPAPPPSEVSEVESFFPSLSHCQERRQIHSQGGKRIR